MRQNMVSDKQEFSTKMKQVTDKPFITTCDNVVFLLFNPVKF